MSSCQKQNILEHNKIKEPQRIYSCGFSLDNFINCNREVLETLYPNILEGILSGELTITETYFTNEMYAQIHEGTQILELDTLFRIDNFSNNKGFLIYSDWYGIIAVSDSGNIDISNYVSMNFPEENPLSETLYEIFSLIDMNAQYMIQHGTPIVVPEDNSLFVIKRKYTTDTTELCRPFVKINIGQNYPWNFYVNLHHPNCPVGCGPVAVAMMFSAFKYPSTIEDISGDWDCIIRDCSTYQRLGGTPENNVFVLARWLHRLGRLSAYSTIGTSTGWNEMKRLINEYPRYTNVRWVNIENSDDEEDFINFITNNKAPLIMYAADLSGWFWDWSLHYFVLDGVIKITNTIERTWNDNHIDYVYHSSFPLVHCNWGWNGRCNGYYRYHKGIDVSECVMQSDLLFNESINITTYQTANPDEDGHCNDYYNKDRKVLKYNYHN